MRNFIENTKFKRALIVFGWITVISGLFTALAFVNEKEKQIRAKKLNINIDYSNNNMFVESSDIRDFLQSRNETIENKIISEIDINKIEKSLSTHPAIKDAQVSLSIDGNMKISIKQKDPLIRVFNLSGESFYLDKDAKLMPLSENYTARVPIATGYIWESLEGTKKHNFKEIGDSPQLNEIFVLDDIFRMAEYLKGNELMNALVHQMNVTKEKEFELFPAVGDQKILFGKCENIKEKFEKLKLFYSEGLNKIDGWNNYSSIDLRFDGQVVCKKKIYSEYSVNNNPSEIKKNNLADNHKGVKDTLNEKKTIFLKEKKEGKKKGRIGDDLSHQNI